MHYSRCCIAVCALVFGISANPSRAQISKGHQILIDRGLQVQGLAIDDCYVTLSTYTNLYYTSINWINEVGANDVPTHSSRQPWLGDPPGFPWSRWAKAETQMPPHMTPHGGDETPFLSQLIAINLADEWNLNDAAWRDRLVNWFVAVRTNWPNTILYHNSWGSQVADGPLADFYTRALPDMLCFDTYPWKSVYDINQPDHIGPPIAGPPTGWYGDLRRYREHARGARIPLGIYRQTFRSVQDYDSTVFRDPSTSELRLNTFGAMAFSATFFTDFVYNTGAASLFTKTFNGSGDTVISTNGLYNALADVNRRARNFGKAMVRLTPIMTEGFPGYTTSMLFIRGRDGSGSLTPIPVGFLPDQDSSSACTDWVFGRNDPFLADWTVTNTGNRNNGQPGDVIVSWFKPLDEGFDGLDYTNEVYIMVVNGLTDPTGSPADCLQEIKLKFHSSLAGIEMLNSDIGIAELQMLPLVNGFRELVLSLGGGDAALFKFADGAPFVGVQKTPVAGPPIMAIHPMDQSTKPGFQALFASHAVGSTPLVYQWQFEGTNIANATYEDYIRTNVQPPALGKYRVIASNASGVVTSAPANLSWITGQPALYESFAYTNIGGPVSDNVPANWAFGGTGANDLKVASGSLSYTGLATSVGNSITNGGAGMGVRRLFGTTFSSGKVYFSALFSIPNLGFGTWNGLGTPVGSFTAASDNTTIRLGVLVKSNSPSGYVIGVRKGGTGATDTYDTTEYHAGQTVFLVGRYDFTAAPDAVALWINPDPSTFGDAQPPATGYITANTGSDDMAIDRFNFRQNTAQSVPAAMQWDELRVGLSWRDVTPIALPVPPAITSQPTNKTVSVGMDAVFTANASGTPPLERQWQFNAIDIPGATNSVYTRTSAQRYHAGNYALTIQSSAGVARSTDAVLTVTPVSPLLLDSAGASQDGNFVLEGSGDPGEFGIEASTNLTNWSQVTNVFSLNGAFQFMDPLSNGPSRYFRARLVP